MIDFIKNQFCCGKMSNYDYSMSLCRIISMFFIIICHTASYFHQNIIGSFFDIGVQIFFIISGYFVSSNEINGEKKWLLKKAIRIFCPLYAWMLFFASMVVIKNNGLPSTVELKQLALMVFNLQGLYQIIPAFKIQASPWFLTAIMLCYIVAVAFKRVEKKFPKICSPIGAIVIFAVSVLLTLVGVRVVNNVFYFLMGYIIKKQNIFELKFCKNIVCIIGTFLFSFGLRFLFYRFLNNSVLYEPMLLPLSRLLLAFSVILAIRWFSNLKSDKFSVIMSKPMFRWLDAISIYVYVFNSAFVGELTLSLPKGINIFVMLFALFSVSTIMFVVWEQIGNLLRKKWRL